MGVDIIFSEDEVHSIPATRSISFRLFLHTFIICCLGFGSLVWRFLNNRFRPHDLMEIHAMPHNIISRRRASNALQPLFSPNGFKVTRSKFF